MAQAMLGTQSTDQGTFAEQATLKQLAMASAARRAGFIAQKSTPPTADPAPKETLKTCSLTEMQWLHKLEHSYFGKELVRNWCIEMINRKKRVPHTALPRILALINNNKDWAAYLLPLIGERGCWLIERSDTYEKFRQTPLWTGEDAPELTPAEKPNEQVSKLLAEMMEGIAHE